jgi:hypothetical protein
MTASDGSEILLLLGSLEPGEPLRSTLALLDWIHRDRSAPPVRVLSLHSGSAAARVRALAPTAVIYDPQGWTVPRVAQRFRMARTSAALRSADLRRRLRTDGPVYVADAAAAPLLRRLAPGTGPVVTHLHASERTFASLPELDRAVLLDRTDRWIVGTPAQAALVIEAGVAADAVATLPDLLDLPGMGQAGPDLVASVRAELHDRHGIPVEAPLAIGIGSEDWWTVPDAFVRVAWETVHRPGGEDVHLLWVADGATERMLWPLRHDLRHAGLDHRVHIDTGDRPTWHHLAACDALLSSRLGDRDGAGHREAELMGTPVLWFDDPEAPEPLVATDAGTSVPFLDVGAMADALLAAIGSRARDVSPADPGRSTAPWLPSVGGPRIVEQLQR